MAKTDQFDKPFDRLFYSCPGAWYGNPPTKTANGHIVVDLSTVHRAVRFIERSRRFMTGSGDAKRMDDGGVMIPVITRPAKGR